MFAVSTLKQTKTTLSNDSQYLCTSLTAILAASRFGKPNLTVLIAGNAMLRAFNSAANSSAFFVHDASNCSSLAFLATTQSLARRQKAWSRSPVNRSVHTAASEERRICSVHYRVYFLPRDVAFNDADFFTHLTRLYFSSEGQRSINGMIAEVALARARCTTVRSEPRSVAIWHRFGEQGMFLDHNF